MTVIDREIIQYDGERLAHEYAAARQRMIQLIDTTSSADHHRIVTACPAWAVRDLIAHVTGIAVDLSAGRAPIGDSQQWVDRQIDERRTRSIDEIVHEWSTACEAFEPMIADSPKAFWGLVYDLVVHEFDLRQALGDREGRDAPGVLVAAELGLRLVKGDLRKAGLGAIVVDMGAERIRIGEGDVELTVRATPFECLRLLGSRRTRAELGAADIDGDLDQYLAALVHMELPVQSLGE